MYYSLDLIPPLFDDLDEFAKSDRTVSFALSPAANSLATFAAPAQLSAKASSSSETAGEEQYVYMASWEKAPSAERRLFITDTSTIFAATQNLLNNVTASGVEFARTTEVMTALRKLVGDYIRHIADCWVQASQQGVQAEDLQLPSDHYRVMKTSLSLFQCLYLPEDGIEDVPVGDELLEWLNVNFVEPSSEEGDHLSSQDSPWQDEAFWPYIKRVTMRGLSKSATFFLSVLSKHPSDDLQKISSRLVALLQNHPRQNQYSTEKEFFTSSRRWTDRVKALRLELDRVPDDDRHDGYDNWWENISDILGVLEGRGEVLQRICTDLGSDWKEVICTWGVWIDIALRRADLPDLVSRINFDMQPDPTDQEDSLHAELFQGRSNQILAMASSIDLWLSAHIADLMLALGLVDAEIDDDSGFSIRDQYVIPYAEYLYSDPELWRITVDYLCTCGEIGRRMADEVLIRVPLRLEGPVNVEDAGETSAESNAMKIDSQEESSDLAGVIKELNATCFEYRREHVRRMICRIAAQKLTDLKKYSLAVSYCRSAEDWPGLGRIVDHVLEEYILHGPRHFASLVADIFPTLQELPSEPGPYSIFIHRLMFAVRYAEFHQRVLNGDMDNAALDLISLFEEGLAPKSWWGVLLNDATPLIQDDRSLYFPSTSASLLLRYLEELTIKTKQGCGDDYLVIFARILKLSAGPSGTKEAFRRLDVLRLALAKYFARCTIAGSTIFAGVNKVGRDL